MRARAPSVPHTPRTRTSCSRSWNRRQLSAATLASDDSLRSSASHLQPAQPFSAVSDSLRQEHDEAAAKHLTPPRFWRRRPHVAWRDFGRHKQYGNGTPRTLARGWVHVLALLTLESLLLCSAHGWAGVPALPPRAALLARWTTVGFYGSVLFHLVPWARPDTYNAALCADFMAITCALSSLLRAPPHSPAQAGLHRAGGGLGGPPLAARPALAGPERRKAGARRAARSWIRLFDSTALTRSPGA